MKKAKCRNNIIHVMRRITRNMCLIIMIRQELCQSTIFKLFQTSHAYIFSICYYSILNNSILSIGKCKIFLFILHLPIKLSIWNISI